MVVRNRRFGRRAYVDKVFGDGARAASPALGGGHLPHYEVALGRALRQRAGTARAVLSYHHAVFHLGVGYSKVNVALPARYDQHGGHARRAGRVGGARRVRGARGFGSARHRHEEGDRVAVAVEAELGVRHRTPGDGAVRAVGARADQRRVPRHIASGWRRPARVVSTAPFAEGHGYHHAVAGADPQPARADEERRDAD